MSSWDVVVVWENGSSCDYLPSSWRVGNKNIYLWPKLPKTKIIKLIDLCEKPSHLYNYDEAAATCKATVTNIESAKALTEKLQFTSNLSSDEVASSHSADSQNERTPLDDIPHASLLKCADCSKMATEFPKLLKSVGATQYDVKEIKKILIDIQNDIKGFTLTPMENKNPHKLKFPLETEEELTKFEDDLKNEEIYNESVKIVSFIGGNNFKKNFHGIMRRLVNRELSLKYAALGRKGKRNFSKLHSFRVVIDAVRRGYPNATETEIITDISTCLATSADRDGGRQMKSLSNKENE